MKTRTPYPTDLNDKQWQILQPLLPQAKPGGRPETYPKRDILNGIFYVVRGGIAWRALPHDLPPYGIVYHYFRQWRLDGTWSHLNDVLRGDVRVLEGRHRQPTAASIDSQSVKMTDRGGDKGFDGAKWIKGRKRHILVDVLGLLLAVTVTRADVQDRDGARTLLRILPHRFTRLRLIWADSAYTGFLATWRYWLRPHHRIRLEIIKRSDQAKGFMLLPKRWVVGVSSKGHMNPVGESPTEVTSSSLVAWEARWREIKTVKPFDTMLFGSMRNTPGCNVQ